MNLPSLRRKPAELERSAQPTLSFDDLVGLVTQFGFNGVQYTQPGQSQEDIAPAFIAMCRAAYKADGIVFSCMAARQLLLSEARFCFRERRNGRGGNLFSTAALAPLETPWPGATTGDLISRMETHNSLAGNWFGTNRYGGIRTLRPDGVKIIVGSEYDYEVGVWDPEAVPIGYRYKVPGSNRDPIFFLADEVAHYAQYPDPEAQFRGMSWLTPVIREIMADKAATDHKLAFFENAATPNLMVKMEVDDVAQWVNYIREFRKDHESVGNAYKTLFLGAGMDATVIGANLQQMDFKATQGAGETRIASAARVPAVVAQISEGLAGSSLNAGNFESSMRLFADMMARPAWRNMAGSLATLVPAPNSGSELWYDDRDIPALKEDIRKAGERQQADAAAIASLITSGFEPDSVVDAVTSGDFNRLVHSGLTSVQLLPPGDQGPNGTAPAATNGNGNLPAPAKASSGGGRSEDFDRIIRELERRERPVEIHAHMPEQAAPQVTVPVTIEAAEPSHMTIEAARAPDVHLNVEPPRVDFAKGSIQVDAPITVEPTKVDIHEGAFRSDTTVEAPHVTVEPAQVTVEAAPTPNVEVRVDAPPPAEVSVQVDAPQVKVDAAPTPEVHVHLPEERKKPTARAVREPDGSLTVRYEEDNDGG